MGILGRFLFLLLLVLPTTLMFFGNGKHSSFVALADDPVEGEEDDVAVETEEAATDEATDSAAVTEGEKTEEEEEEEDTQLKPSPSADAVLVFTSPTGTTDLPAGLVVRFLVGFTNKGDKKFTVESLDASFRYPQDYSFFIQNFTTATYNQDVEPKKQASFEYGFTPSESFAGRPFGLSILLNYKDEDGNQFMNAVFNETVNIVESEEGLDGETFFLYVFLAAVAVLLLVGAQQLLANFGRKHLSKPRQVVEMGTQNSNVDYSWIPKETLQHAMNRSPGRSPKQSPRQRRSKRSTSAGEE